MTDNPEVTRRGLLDMQVCVPKDWTDDQIRAFAEAENPAGTSGGWSIRKEGDKLLAGSPERMPCDDRESFVHVMLDAILDDVPVIVDGGDEVPDVGSPC